MVTKNSDKIKFKIVKPKSIVLHFTILVTKENINIVKLLKDFLANSNTIEIDDEIDINYEIEGDLSDNAVKLMMLFNTSLCARPTIEIIRK